MAVTRVVEFETEYDAKGEGRDKVLIAPGGQDHNRTQVWHYVDHINPEKVPERLQKGNSWLALRARWEIVGPQYEAWKKGETLPDEGTPLAAWAGISSAQAKILRASDVRSVEEVADMADGIASRVPDGQRLKGLAKKWLEGQDSAAKDAEMADLRAQLAALQEAVDEKPRKKKAAA